MANEKRLIAVECTAIETKLKPNKHHEYVLANTWSDGIRTQCAVPYSVFAELKARLKNDCYRNRKDVSIPDLPAKRRDIVAAVRREDRRKKAIDDFFQEILTLPDLPEKWRILSELFGSSSTTQDESSAVLYAVVDKSKSSPAVYRLQDAVQYAELDFDDSADAKSGGKPFVVPTPTIYSEVSSLVEPLAAAAAADSSTTDNEHLYSNVASDCRVYENVSKGTCDTKTEIKLCKVIEKYVANTEHSQGLSVEAGDVVQVQMESGGRGYCTLQCSGITVRPLEGWVPTSVLRPCSSPDDKHGPDVAAASAVAAGQQEDAGPRPAPRNFNSNNKKPIEKKFSNPQVLDITCMHDSVTSPIPVMPTSLSPTLRFQTDAGLSDEHCALFDSSTAASAAADNVDGKDDGSQSLPAIIRAKAVADLTVAAAASIDPGVIPFRRGDVGELIYASDTRWWCIRTAENVNGWVPAAYWRILTEDGRVTGHSSTAAGRDDDAPWMVGKLTRTACEQMMLTSGRQRDFVIRESSNLSGQLALSVLYNRKVHHFPIVPTKDAKFYIGKHHFTTVYNVVIYYTKNTLFVDDENGQSVTLGRPFRLPTSTTTSS
jgi:hypothetical protein